MITLKEGTKEYLPYVKVEISTGYWPFSYWFEVSYYDADNKIGGASMPCWVHDWERDGGGFGLWFVLRKADQAMQDCFDDLLVEATNKPETYDEKNVMEKGIWNGMTAKEKCCMGGCGNSNCKHCGND